MNHTVSKSLLLLALVFFAVTNASATFTTIDEPGTGEASIYEILDQLYGLQNLTRIDDANAYKTDVEWYFGEGKTSAEIKTVASYAGYNNTFGVLDSLRFTGILKSKELDSQKGEWRTIYSNQFNDEKFHLAITTPESDVWSSDQAKNPDGGIDHMVTWLISGTDGFADNEVGNYIVAFEDLKGMLSDWDFNDFVLEIRGLEDGVIAAIPEPATVALLALGLLGIGCRRRAADS